MSLFVRQRSEGYRLRDGDKITAERFGMLHQGSPVLEWGSITKTVAARITEQLDHAGTLDLSAPVSVYLPEAKLPREVDVRSLVTHTSGLPRLPQGIITNAAEARDPYAKHTTVPPRLVWVVEGGATPVETVLRQPDVTVSSRVERGAQNSGPAFFERKSLPSRRDYAQVSESEYTRMCFVVGILAPFALPSSLYAFTGLAEGSWRG